MLKHFAANIVENYSIKKIYASYYIKGTKFKAFEAIHLSQNILIQKELKINII